MDRRFTDEVARMDRRSMYSRACARVRAFPSCGGTDPSREGAPRAITFRGGTAALPRRER